MAASITIDGLYNIGATTIVYPINSNGIVTINTNNNNGHYLIKIIGTSLQRILTINATIAMSNDSIQMYDYTPNMNTQDGQPVTINFNTNYGLKTFTPSSNTGYIYLIINNQNNMVLDISTNIPNDTFSCFLPTTRILMVDNTYKRISQIKKGETIRGLSGIPRRVLHAGYVKFTPERTHPESLPRCIPMNFFGKNLPRENLYLSGGHSVVLLESNEKYRREIEETERETGRTVNMSGYRKLMSKKLSNLRILKTTEEIKNLTGLEPRYYHLVIDDISDGMIVDGLPVEATSEENFIDQGFIEN